MQIAATGILANMHTDTWTCTCIRVGRFLPESGKKRFFSTVKTGLGKILFAGRLPAKIGLCQNSHH